MHGGCHLFHHVGFLANGALALQQHVLALLPVLAQTELVEFVVAGFVAGMGDVFSDGEAGGTQDAPGSRGHDGDVFFLLVFLGGLFGSVPRGVADPGGSDAALGLVHHVADVVFVQATDSLGILEGLGVDLDASLFGVVHFGQYVVVLVLVLRPSSMDSTAPFLLAGDIKDHEPNKKGRQYQAHHEIGFFLLSTHHLGLICFWGELEVA